MVKGHTKAVGDLPSKKWLLPERDDHCEDRLKSADLNVNRGVT